MSPASPVVLITGASAGLGEALAREFLCRGSRVALLARRVERLEALSRELDPSGKTLLVQSCDVTQDGDLPRAVAATLQKFERLDIVIANAGYGVSGLFQNLALEAYRRQFETNVFGLLRTVETTLPALRASKGQIALIGSVTGFMALPGASPYAMSKFAVNALAQSLYQEFLPLGVSVTHVVPGFVRTEFRQVSSAGRLDPNKTDWVPTWISAPAPKIARWIVDALRSRPREIVLPWHAKAIVFLARYGAWLVPLLVRTFRIRRRD